jgi:tRNA (guanine-N7-)-methyltransferase
LANDPRPLEIELGSGKGTFLCQQAPMELNKLFLGIEWSAPFYRYAADRARRAQMFNVQMLRVDGPVFIHHFVADRSVRQFHWYFPDPWPKARHNRRRTFQEGFLRDLHRVLIDPVAQQPDTGRIRVVTDHLDYWEWMQVEADKVADIFEREDYVPPISAGPGEFVGSNFERKYIVEGRRIQGMILRKK